MGDEAKTAIVPEIVGLIQAGAGKRLLRHLALPYKTTVYEYSDQTQLMRWQKWRHIL
jgi:hypothetical protein